jgi:hypothetical protein
MFARSDWKTIPLMVAVLVVVITSPTPAMANRHGIWWGLWHREFTLTLVNLTDQALTLAANTVAVGPSDQAACYPYPFQHHTLQLPQYSSAIWMSDTSRSYPDSVQYYRGKMTFQIQGMGSEWQFDLNFLPEDLAGSFSPGKGTWIYLTATDVSNPGWTPSWEYAIYDWIDLGFPGYRGYATPLNDAGYLHNQMNLEGTDLAITVYTSDNINVTLVVQQTHALNYPPETYRKWELDWVDNDNDGVPSS